jgi:hypothetical protein
MRIFVCERCGGNDFRQEKGFRTCQYCNTSYVLTAEEMPQKLSNISLNDDIKSLLNKCKNDPTNARRYASLVLDIDPTNSEARRFLNR